MTSNEEKLRNLLAEVLLLDDDQYQDDYGPDQIGTWDSLASIGIAAAIEENFDYVLTPEELALMDSIGDIKKILNSAGVKL